MSQPREVALTVNDFAALLGIRRETVWRWRRFYGLPTLKVGTARMIPLRGFMEWVHADGAPDRTWIRRRVEALQANGSLAPDTE